MPCFEGFSIPIQLRRWEYSGLAYFSICHFEKFYTLLLYKYLTCSNYWGRSTWTIPPLKAKHTGHNNYAMKHSTEVSNRFTKRSGRISLSISSRAMVSRYNNLHIDSDKGSSIFRKLLSFYLAAFKLCLGKLAHRSYLENATQELIEILIRCFAQVIFSIVRKNLMNIQRVLGIYIWFTVHWSTVTFANDCFPIPSLFGCLGNVLGLTRSYQFGCSHHFSLCLFPRKKESVSWHCVKYCYPLSLHYINIDTLSHSYTSIYRYLIPSSWFMQMNELQSLSISS